MLGVILPGRDASAGASKSASRGFGGHAEGRHLILRFVEEGVHGRLRTKENRSRATYVTLGRCEAKCQRFSKFPAAGHGGARLPEQRPCRPCAPIKGPPSQPRPSCKAALVDRTIPVPRPGRPAPVR